MNDSQKISLESPPPYNQSSYSPLVLAETTRTRTEVVTTTTTQTTHFSLPQFRKRAGPSQQSDDYSNHKLPATLPPSDKALFEKALPPTPPNQIGRSQNDSVIMHSQDLVTSCPVVQQAADTVHFATPSPQTRSSAALSHAALGTAPHLGINTIPFVSSPSPVPVLTPTIRKSRSFQWLKRNVSENRVLSHDDHPKQSVNERHRGLSFGADLFPSISVIGDGDKGKSAEPSSVGPKAASKTISRRASFWVRKRVSPESEPPNHPSHSEGILTMPTLPSVHHVSPFNIAHFTEAPSFPIQTTATTHTAPFSDPSCDAKSCETVAPLPRQRAQTNPPFFRRFSMVFSALEPSSPLDLHASNSDDFPAVTPTVVRQATPKPAIPKPLSKEESPDIYLTRLQSAVSKAEIAGILASRYVPSSIYLHYIHSRSVRIRFMLRPFGHTSINLTFLALPLTSHCGNCSWK
jgi:hypothetical protein